MLSRDNCHVLHVGRDCDAVFHHPHLHPVVAGEVAALSNLAASAYDLSSEAIALDSLRTGIADLPVDLVGRWHIAVFDCEAQASPDRNVVA